MNLKVEFGCLTKPQLLALFQFFKNWEILCSQGSSRKMSFYVDGDGNFHPKIGIELPTEINEDDLRLTQQFYENKTEIDFDDIAWKLDDKEPPMKLIGKQILVELPDKAKQHTMASENTDAYILWCNGYNQALSEVARMNPAMEVDEKSMREYLINIFSQSEFYRWEYIREYCEALASNPSAWLKRKDSDE